MRSLKHKKMKKAFIKLNIILLSVTLIFPLISYIDAQELDEDFLNSLPEDIKIDVISNIENTNSELSQTKQYDSFSSSVEKQFNEEEVDALSRFGDEYFNSMPSTFMPINDPAASSDYILDVDDILFIQLIGDRSEEYEYKIDRSGNISIPDIGFIKLAGLSLMSANELINKTLREYFVKQKLLSLLRKSEISAYW